MLQQNKTIAAGAAIFGKLKALGVDFVFANSGTDFPPIIEGLIQARFSEVDLPTAVVVPHEMAAVSMAHGYYLISGKAQAVMLHTNVGLSNGATGAINAARDQVPMLLMSGRTPVTEKGRFGARTVPIGWGQEMFDQAALVREACKWEYELRFPEQISEVIERGWAIANSTPKGPVYYSLPREVLCEQSPLDVVNKPSSMAPVSVAPDPQSLKQAAALLAQAKNPLVISQRGICTEKAFQALSDFLVRWAMPLSQYWATALSVPVNHPCHIGTTPNELVAESDVILVINGLAPWWPDRVTLRDDVKIIQLGPDPLFAQTPIRNFPADVTLAGPTAPTVLALIAEMENQKRDQQALLDRLSKVMALAHNNQERADCRAKMGNRAPMSKEWVSLCLGRAVKDKKVTIFEELGCPLAPLDLEHFQSFFEVPPSGGLGWGVPAALGAQLADRERLIFATVGDGSYIFANPTACHQVAEALQLPIIILVLNNEEWGAVRHAVKELYKDGFSVKSNDIPLTSLKPIPDFTKTAEASNAYTETVTEGQELPAALNRAIDIAETEKRHVLLNISIEKTRGAGT